MQLKISATDEVVEEALDFQLEELTLMAKKELELVHRMAEWRPWEVPEVGDSSAHRTAQKYCRSGWTWPAFKRRHAGHPGKRSVGASLRVEF